MTNEHEHEKLPSGKLAEAVESMADVYEDFGAGAKEMIILDAARKYAALEPLLRELCEARGRATEGKWVPCNNEGFSMWKIWGRMSPTGNGTPGPLIADFIGDSSETDANVNFIATAANITARIREVVQS